MPNSVWDNGEGFPNPPGPDQGGYLSGLGLYAPDNFVAGMTIGDVHSFIATGSGPLQWHGYNPVSGQPASVSRFLGHLRPASLGAYSAGEQVEDAAFEFFAPLTRNPNLPLVVVISTWSTSGTPPELGSNGLPLGNPKLSLYPGHRRTDGLVIRDDAPDGIFRPSPSPIDLVANPLGNYQVIAGYIVPRTFPRPLVFELQRAVQLAKAIDLMLAQPTGSPFLPPGTDPIATPLPKMIAGASMGGFTSCVATLAYPNVFHGGSIGAFSASPRRTMGEQFSWDYIGRRNGLGLHETSLSLLDSLEWGTGLRQLGWDYFNASLPLRRRLGLQPRPFISLLGEEDTVTCGVDWLPLMSGVRDFRQQGIAALPSGHGPAEFWWTLVDRRGHGEGGAFLTPILGNASTWPPDSEREFIGKLQQHWQAFPVVPAPITLTDDGTEDPYDHHLARGLTTPSPNHALLALDPGFGLGGRTHGQGLCLGADESLKSAVVNGQAYVYVGDADGIVHRFAFDAPTQSLVEQARSPSLGFGAWALEVGVVDGSGSPVVVVGTFRDLYQLDPLTLQPISGRHFTLDFERERPRRIAIAEVFAEEPQKEILCATFQGHLLVFDHQFALVADLGEPGIQDFVVHEGMSYPWSQTSSQVPITLLSQRGHLVNITLSRVGYPGLPAELHCWTPGEAGGPYDLERVVDGGQTQVVASYGLNVGFDSPVKRFDAFTLQPAGGSHLGQFTSSASGAVRDLEAVHDDASGNLLGYVTIADNYISWVPLTGSPSFKVLSTFAPAFRPIAMRAVDLMPSLPNDPREELVIATLSGHLVWLRLSDFTGFPELGVSLPRPTLPAAPQYPRTNHTLAGTWGMVWRQRWIESNETGDDDSSLFPDHRIYAATQAGELFEVHPGTGQAWLHADMKHLQEFPPIGGQPASYAPIEPESPIRDLIWIGDGVTQVSGQAPELLKQPTPPIGTDWWLNTRPWLNKSSWYLTPAWYKDPTVILTPGGPVYDAEPSPEQPIYNGFVPLTGGGAAGAYAPGDPWTYKRDWHWWGGARPLFPNLVQGAYATDTTVTGNWYSTNDTGPVPVYGRTPWDCKDLRNMTADAYGTAYGMQSLRLGRDGGGRVVVLTTSGGGVTLIRPYGPDITKHGEILWSNEDPLPPNSAIDDGYGAMALAVRQVPGASPPQLDIFYGTALSYPDPTQLPPAGAAQVSSALRWLRWDSTQSTGNQMTPMGAVLHLDPGASDSRGGFAICGLAVGDIIQNVGPPDAELVATTLAGDLYVFDISAGVINPTPVVRVWVDGALGAYNSILIEDMDMDLKNELYVAGSQGIWKWRQP